MTTFEFKLPDIGEGVTEGEIVLWRVREGDFVAEDQPLVEVMTDKATVLIPSPQSGRVLKLHGKEGEQARVHQPLVTLQLEAALPRPPPAAPPVPRAPTSSGGAATLSPEGLVEVYRAMLQSRLLDERMMALQRQGRIGFYGTGIGQEAACLASAYALRPSDWIFPGLRENAAMLLRGYPLVPYLAQLFGNSGDELKGRQMPAHQASRRVHQVSWSSCIGTQLPQAVGAAWAARHKRQDMVVLAYLGDGATSTGDFHAAMNFAGVLQAPVVFLCQNNHWSISLHVSRQTRSETLAIKASAYGLPGVRVDGNDAEAVYAATSEAVARARSGQGPTFIEAVTYRVSAHSSSDDPSRYQEPRELAEWKARDPLERLRARLAERGLWDASQEEALRAELLRELNAAIHEAESLPPPPPESLFDDVYAEEPWHLAEQRRELQRALPRTGPWRRSDGR